MGIIQCLNPSSNFIPSSDCRIDTSSLPFSPSDSNYPSIPASSNRTNIIKTFQKRKILPKLVLAQSTTISSSSTAQTSFSNTTAPQSNPHPVPLTSKSQHGNFKTSFSTSCLDSSGFITDEIAAKALNNIHTHSIPHKTGVAFQNAVNLTIIGPSKVGKSCFAIRLTDCKFNEAYIPSISLEVGTRLCKVKKQTKTMNIYTVPSSKHNKDNYEMLLQTNHIVLVIYDVTNERSFDEAKKMYEKEFVYKNDKTPQTNLDYTNSNMPVVSFVGNKIDLKYDQSLINKVDLYCNDNYISNYLVSAKTAKGIRNLMHSVLDKLN